MASQYSKENILNILKEKVSAKGFVLDVEKGDKKGIAKTTPTLLDMLEALAEALEAQLEKGDKDASLVASDFKIGPSGQQMEVATKSQPGEVNVKFDATTDPKFFTWIETLHSLLQNTYPISGYGSPNSFAIALKTLLSNKPTSLTGKIIKGSSKIKVTV